MFFGRISRLNLLGQLATAKAIAERDRQRTLRRGLPDDVLVERGHDFPGREVLHGSILRVGRRDVLFARTGYPLLYANGRPGLTSWARPLAWNLSTATSDPQTLDSVLRPGGSEWISTEAFESFARISSSRWSIVWWTRSSGVSGRKTTSIVT